MTDRFEALDRARHRMLLGFLAAFVAWQAPLLLRDALETALPEALSGAAALVGSLASIVWIVYFVRLMRLRREMSRDPELDGALNDERVQAVRGRAFTVGFWTLIVFLAAVRLAAPAVALSVAVVTQLGLVLSAVAAVSAFLVLDRE